MSVLAGNDGFTFEARFDGICFDVLSSSITEGREVVRHKFPKIDGVNTEDMGGNGMEISLEIIFVDHGFQVDPVNGDQGDYLERFRTFRELASKSAVRTLLHPYVGAVSCRIGDFSHNADGDGQPVIRASVQFIEDTDTEPVLRAADAFQPLASSQEVETELLSLQAAALGIGYETPIADGVLAEVQDWENDADLSAREIAQRMATLSNQLNDELNAFEDAADLDNYPLVKAYTKLQYQVRQVAEAVISETNRLVRLETTEPLPMRIIAARFYGAKDHERRTEELLDLNPEIRDPTLVPRGVKLKAFSIA